MTAEIVQFVPPSLLTCGSITAPAMTFCGGRVAIHHDGTITFGEGYEPTEAARQFWDAVGVERKNRANLDTDKDSA